jgi:class 3 adenylate cyclase
VAQPPRTPPHLAAPDAYTPKHLAERILTSRSALEGERKQVTVLFADLKGSMELLADRDPEEARKLLDPVLERMMEAVHRYEGTVNQVMGDGIMALFGAPLAHEDHAVRACYAALDMQAAIRRHAEEARAAHGINPQIRVGLNSGEVVVRAIGSDLHMDYTAVGQTTHLAARMEQLAGPGATVLTADTLRLAEGYIERTEGNPFFLEESVRTLVETGALLGERAAYRLGRPTEAIQVPATVQAVLAARIDRLPSEEKGLLQTASVIGYEVPATLLQAVADLPSEALDRSLMSLQAAELLYETSLFPDVEYTFKHALTHDVAYGSLLHDRRRRLHATIVEVLERLHPDPQGPSVDRLAHHAIRAEAWDRGVRYARRAGAQAFERSANQEAAGWFERAIDALSHLTDSRERLEAAVDLRLALRNALVPLRGQRAVVDLLAEAHALAEALGDARRIGWVAAYRLHALIASGDVAGAFASGERALALADQLGDLGLQVFARSVVGTACVDTGDLRRAVSLFRWGIERLLGPLARERFGTVVLGSVYTRGWAARTLAELGEFPEARDLAAEAVSLAEAADHPFSLLVGWWATGWVDLVRGALSDAIRALEHALALSRTWSIMLYLPNLIPALARAYAGAGRREDAESLLGELRHAAEQEGSLVAFRGQAGTALAEVHLGGGRLDVAHEAARATLDRCRAQGFRSAEGHALRLLGEIAARRNPPDLAEAERCFEEARTLAAELGTRPLAAHCHLGLGTLYRRVGRYDLARDQLTAAATLYREMDMAFYLAKAEAALRECR